MLLKMTMSRDGGGQPAAAAAKVAVSASASVSESESESQSEAEAQDDLRLARARGGDDAAFAEIVRRHQAMVFSLAWRIVGNRALAEELAQDVFLQLHRSLATLESGAHLVHWLRRVVSHRAIDLVRQQARRPQASLSDLPEPDAIRNQPADPLLADRLRDLVATLPPAPRAVVTLRFQEDLDLSEIAAVLNMPLNTVKSHLRRSLALLRGRAQALLEPMSHVPRR